MNQYSVVRSLVHSCKCNSKTLQLLNFNYIVRNYSSSKMDKNIGKRSVLSIQSHVVHGYVGNKSATFPLQVLGFEVDAINSVHFSNHTGYDAIKGQVMNEEQLNEVFDGLKSNNLLNEYTHLLTGYIGNESFLRKVADIVKQLREENPNLIYVCDPVMGDDGFMYVPKALLPIYRDEIIPLADITTPNQFEVELLTDIKLKTENDAWKALEWFHNRGVGTVALSSTNLGRENTLLAFLSHRNKVTGHVEKYKLPIPILGNGIQFTGTGDLFAALFLAHSTMMSDIGKALEATSSTLHSVIQNTIKCMPNEVLTQQRKVTSRERELKIIQSKATIENPIIKFNAEKL